MSEINVTATYNHNEQAYRQGFPLILHQGGTRSGKTFNTLKWLIIKARTEWKNYVIDIVRETMTALSASALFDFILILEEMKIYEPTKHNKTKNIYKLGTNTFRFFGADEDQKVRGPGRDVLFINEMNGVKSKTYKQLNQRTKVLTIGDYNPSDEFHWIYEDLVDDEDTAFFKTTYLDNPFLPDRIIKIVEDYKRKDMNYWRIYGLGERGVSETTIYSNWELTDLKFDDFEGQRVFGMDFGFNDPTVLVKVRCNDFNIFVQQLLHKGNLTSEMIIDELEKLVELEELDYDDPIYCDSARPEIIQAMRDAGFNAHSVKKEKDSILRGINYIKMRQVFITKESVETAREFKSYKWRVDKDDHVLDKPVDANDHSCDAIRYAVERISRSGGDAMILEGGEALFG